MLVSIILYGITGSDFWLALTVICGLTTISKLN